MVGRGNTLHVVLFDFSLSRTPTENIRAGTTGYLDPLLSLRKPPRWDLHAERYAAAATLYELATGTLPRWGDGATDPSHLTCEITIDAELFDASLRERLTEFFRKAFRRDVTQRFDNAEEMLTDWRHCFENIDQPGSFSDHEDEETLRELLATSTFDTPIHELGLGTRATNALTAPICSPWKICSRSHCDGSCASAESATRPGARSSRPSDCSASDWVAGNCPRERRNSTTNHSQPSRPIREPSALID